MVKKLFICRRQTNNSILLFIYLYQPTWCTKFYNKCISSLYMFRAHVLETCRGLKTYRCDDTRDCIIQFCPPDDEHMFSKHVEAWNKLITKFSASSWLILINKYIEMHGQQNMKEKKSILLVYLLGWLRVSVILDRIFVCTLCFYKLAYRWSRMTETCSHHNV